jgi:hypothetical protein
MSLMNIRQEVSHVEALHFVPVKYYGVTGSLTVRGDRKTACMRGKANYTHTSGGQILIKNLGGSTICVWKDNTKMNPQ